MTGITTLRFNAQAQSDLQRMMRELVNLQGQTASSTKSNNLSGFGSGAARLLTAQSMRATTDGHGAAISQMIARFGVQAAALDQVSTAVTDLAQSLRTAIAANDGRGIEQGLKLAFSATAAALNESWNGQPLFAGQRTDSVGPVQVKTIEELASAVTDSQVYNEAEDVQTFTLTGGVRVNLAEKASDLSRDLFDTFRSMHGLLNGGDLGSPLSADLQDQLLSYAQQLEEGAKKFVDAEGRAGQLEKRFEIESSRLQDRSDLLSKQIGGYTDIDLAEVSVQISSLLAQYQAAAKTFTDISKLSLLDYL